jgi:membrane protease YdiL (CAAX protease family)
MDRPGSVPRRTTVHPLLAIAVLAVGVPAMSVPIVAAQVAAARGHAVGLRPLLVASELMLILPAIVLLLALRRPLGPSLALAPLGRAGITIAVCAGMALWAASVGLLSLQTIAWPPSEEFLETFRRLHAALQPRGVFDAMLSIFAIAVVPALCEEILFRGVILPSLARVLPVVLAVAASALLFGVIHVDWVSSGPAFTRIPFAIVVGVGLGALRARTGSLVAPILAHAVLNTITFVTVLATGAEAEMEIQEPVLAAALLVGGSALTAIALRQARPPLTAPEPQPRLAE